jgi:hypothetical protein
MYVDLKSLRQQYADLSDEALLAIRRDELVEDAQKCYDEELRRRNLIFGEARVSSVEAGDEQRPEWLDDAAEVYSAIVLPQANAAEDAETAASALRNAGIPCYVELVELEPGANTSGAAHEYRVLVPGKYNLRGVAVLDCEIFNPDWEADYRMQLEQVPNENLADMHPQVALAGLYDRIERAKKAYEEEQIRRNRTAGRV